MNCQLELSAKQKIPCETSDSISHCLSFVEGDAWTTYNGFYHHCEMICYTYQAILWQGDTNHFLKGLADNTLEVRSIVYSNISFFLSFPFYFHHIIFFLFYLNKFQIVTIL